MTLISLKNYLLTIVLAAVVASPASATCFHFGYYGEANPKAKVCRGDGCSTIEMVDYCGSMWGYSASFLLSNSSKLGYLCEVASADEITFETTCTWKLDGVITNDHNWKSLNCVPLDLKNEQTENDPCVWLLK